MTMIYSNNSFADNNFAKPPEFRFWQNPGGRMADWQKINIEIQRLLKMFFQFVHTVFYFTNSFNSTRIFIILSYSGMLSSE